MTQNDKVRDLLLEDVEEEIPTYTCFNSHEFDSVIRGYHVYQHIWTTVEGETYICTREPGNEQDCNAVFFVFFFYQIISTYYKRLQQTKWKWKYNIKYKHTTTTETYAH